MTTKLIITGAAGGMGRACARLLATSHDLVLCDVSAGPLEAFAEELARDGHAVAGVIAGDLGSDEVLSALGRHSDGAAPFALIHTAGVSPAQAGWRPILEANLVATEKLLRLVEARLVPGTAAVLIASAAGHIPVAVPSAWELMADPLAPDCVDRLGAAIQSAMGENTMTPAGVAYSLSKARILRTVEDRAAAWGKAGARILSISPGLMRTPMGRSELDLNPAARAHDEATPAGRPGTAMDVAHAARFLLAPEAGYLTGSDLKVDGGSIAAVRAMMRGARG